MAGAHSKGCIVMDNDIRGVQDEQPPSKAEEPPGRMGRELQVFETGSRSIRTVDNIVAYLHRYLLRRGKLCQSLCLASSFYGGRV